jgi:hypothetical protein
MYNNLNVIALIMSKLVRAAALHTYRQTCYGCLKITIMVCAPCEYFSVDQIQKEMAGDVTRIEAEDIY